MSSVPAPVRTILAGRRNISGEIVMSTARSAAGLRLPPALTQSFSKPIRGLLAAIQEWRKYEELRTRLCDLTDRELMDMGISRGEIDHVAANRSNDPRDVRS
jgi:uncharacterized protein YjiS (DUF1127 family)